MSIWPFHRRLSIEDSGVLKGYTDWHCHLLPGVDDGVEGLDECIGLLAIYEIQGVRVVWMTPHIMEDIPNTPEFLRKVFDKVKAAYKGNMVLHLAAEHMLDHLFEERLENGQVMPIGPERRYLLVETSYFNPPANMDALLERIRSKGFIPILAHPERYNYMNDADYRKYKQMGVLFQLNIFSLVGSYGKTAQRKARLLLKSGMYDVSGTDTHCLENFENDLLVPALLGPLQVPTITF